MVGIIYYGLCVRHLGCYGRRLVCNTWVTSATSVIVYLGSINCTCLDRHNFLIICGSYSEKMKEEKFITIILIRAIELSGYGWHK